jgi:folate-binding protein YgfZ
MTPAFFDLSAHVKLRVSGADSFRFLNGQITNDLRKATPRLAMQASILTAKGKLAAHVFLAAEEAAGEFLIDADEALRDTLQARLERYVIADDVVIEDVTDQFSIFHVTGATIPQDVPVLKTIAAKRLGESGFDLWVERSQSERVRAELSAHFAFADADAAETVRIEKGIPRWGRELTDEIIPVEANLDETSIDYAKGCYIGQEVISRMKMSGQTNKRLRGLVSLDGSPLTPGARLHADGDSTREVGWITSATRSPQLDREIALGFVKRGSNDEGTRLVAATDTAVALPVLVTELPFI